MVQNRASSGSSDARIVARPERRYWLRTDGFDGYEVRAASAGAARWKSFLSYDEAGYGHDSWGQRWTKSERFKRFLERTICHALGPVSDGASTRQEYAEQRQRSAK